MWNAPSAAGKKIVGRAALAAQSVHAAPTGMNLMRTRAEEDRISRPRNAKASADRPQNVAVAVHARQNALLRKYANSVVFGKRPLGLVLQLFGDSISLIANAALAILPPRQQSQDIMIIQTILLILAAQKKERIQTTSCFR